MSNVGKLPRSTRLEREARVSRFADDPGQGIAYSHTVLCQTVLPYKDPGDDVRTWERVNGDARLKVIAGEMMDARTKEFKEVGLPFGPKPRLILYHVNAEALRQGRPDVEIEDSLSAFTRRMNLHSSGRTTNTIREQLRRLSASTVRLGLVRGDRALTVNTSIVTAFDLWDDTSPIQPNLWNSTIQLSEAYFKSLQAQNAVPLSEAALAGLSGAAIALDFYSWVAQRLHRVDPKKPQTISWRALKVQFGQGYTRERDFRRTIIGIMHKVIKFYPAARIEVGVSGLTLHHSPSPVAPRVTVVSGG